MSGNLRVEAGAHSRTVSSASSSAVTRQARTLNRKRLDMQLPGLADPADKARNTLHQ
jgi:hypothetical protein